MASSAGYHVVEEVPVQVQAIHRTLKLVGTVVLLLMAVAIVYAAVISVTYWTGIGV